MSTQDHGRTIRIGVFQIASHPSVVIAGRDLLLEPFVPQEWSLGISPLSSLALDISHCTASLKAQYIKWQLERLEQLLGWLVAQPSHPDIVVFPECSIPFECLSLLAAYARKWGIVFFAGTHTPLTTSQAQTTYKKALGVPGAQVKAIIQSTTPPAAVLPIIDGVQTTLHSKAAPSIFERTDVHTTSLEPISCEIIQISRQHLKVIPLICAEALRLQNFDAGRPDLAILVAYERRPERFNRVISAFVENQIPVVLANDATFGGSSILSAVDNRTGEWWTSPPNNGRLPNGECYLEVELDLQVAAIEVGVATPRAAARLIKLAPILSADDKNLQFEIDARAKALAQDVHGMEGLLLSASVGESLPPLLSRRWQCILAMLKSETLQPVWLDIIGESITPGSLVNLHSLEKELSRCAKDTLERVAETSDSSSLTNDQYGQLTRCLREMRRRCDPELRRSQSREDVISTTTTPFGRNEILPELRAFCGKRGDTVMVLSGLEAVGKSTVVLTAIRQAGTRYVHINCEPGCSADFIFEYILKASGRVVAGQAPRKDFNADDIVDAIKDVDVLWIDNCHNLLDYGKFRTSAIELLIQRLIEARQRTTTRLLFESRRSLPLAPPFGVQVVRRRLSGLVENDGSGFFDQQLRRAGIPLEVVSVEDRKTIVQLVDGHPGMLILCADASEKLGIAGVIAELKGRRGFYWSAVLKLYNAIDLSDLARSYIELLAVSRVPIAANVLNSSADSVKHFDALTELIGACLVDRVSGDRIIITPLLRELTLEPLTLTLQERADFHKRACMYFRNESAHPEPVVVFRSEIEANYHALLGNIALPFDLAGLNDSLSAAARMKYEMQSYGDVISLLGPEANEKMPEDLLAILAESYAWCDQYGEAFRIAEQVVTRNRTYIWLFIEMCNAAMRSRRWDQARLAIERAAAYEPGSYLVALYRGRLAEKRNIDEAIVLFHEAAQKSEKDPWPYFYLARALVQRGRAEEALEAIDAGRSLVQGRAWHPSTRSIERALLSQELLALLLTGDHEHAKLILEALEKAEDPRPEVLVSAAYIRAYFDAESGEGNVLRAFDTALSRLSQRDSKQAHTRAQIAMFKGKLLEKIGDLGGAESEFNRACELDVHNVHMKICLLRVLRAIAKSANASKNDEAAISAATRASKIAQDILTYDSNQRDALYAVEDIYREFGIQ